MAAQDHGLDLHSSFSSMLHMRKPGRERPGNTVIRRAL